MEEAIISKVLDMSERSRRLIPVVIESVERPIWLYGIVGVDFTAKISSGAPLKKLIEALGDP